MAGHAAQEAAALITYRFARPDDVDELAVVHTRAWQAGYEGLIDAVSLAALDPAKRAASFRTLLDPATHADQRVTWVVALLGETIVGHAISRILGDNAELDALYLAPEAWGTGIGHALHDMALRGLHRFGARSAHLNVLKGNERAIAFYEQHGWSMTAGEHRAQWAGLDVVHHVMEIELSVDLLRENRQYWNSKAPDYAARQQWDDDVGWGIHGISDKAAGHIFPDVAGRDVIEIGCGTGYVSYWASQRGARTTIGIDNSPAQLATAAERTDTRGAAHGMGFPLVLGDGHHLPFADESFDVAINEYGAAIWCDPRIWIPEAARVLRSGGLIWFLGNSVQFMLCAPEFEGELAAATMLRPQRDMHRFEWIDTNNVEFHVSHGEMISILTRAGFVIEALHELYASADSPASEYGLADGEWASKWPIEDVWVARKK